MNTTTTSKTRLDEGVRIANDMVIATSLAIMDTNTVGHARKQASFFQDLFSSVRDVLDDARRGYWEPGDAPDAWENSRSSQAALRLADALIRQGEDN